MSTENRERTWIFQGVIPTEVKELSDDWRTYFDLAALNTAIVSELHPVRTHTFNDVILFRMHVTASPDLGAEELKQFEKELQSRMATNLHSFREKFELKPEESQLLVLCPNRTDFEIVDPVIANMENVDGIVEAYLPDLGEVFDAFMKSDPQPQKTGKVVPNLYVGDLLHSGEESERQQVLLTEVPSLTTGLCRARLVSNTGLVEGEMITVHIPTLIKQKPLIHRIGGDWWEVSGPFSQRYWVRSAERPTVNPFLKIHRGPCELPVE